jgi:hypothetical protein
MTTDRFRADRALAPIKAFQRRTVDYVYDRLYGDMNPVRHFLVADEVGLGKTMVARGVIARTIEQLWDTTKRIDILYICSNQAIAAQNLNRLNVLGRSALALPTRMTLIPLQFQNQLGLDANKVNFISLTPGTTFDLKSSTGVTQERALLFHLLTEVVSHHTGLRNMLQVNAGFSSWEEALDGIYIDDIDRHIVKRFRRDVKADRKLLKELERICECFPRRRENYPQEMTQPRNKLVARLRAKLSHACVDALQPDLIIMDEFQRFRDLLHGDNDAAILARELFEYTGSDGQAARTLLLSATPYRMLTLTGDDPEEGDHYKDFLETLTFLYGREKGPDIATTLAAEMQSFRGFLHSLPQSHEPAVEARKSVEQKLRQVIARTERVSSTAERDSMMKEVPLTASVMPADLEQAAAVAQVARTLEAPGVIEYWKSSPYLLNFMRDYTLKSLLTEQAETPSELLREAIQAARSTMLNQKSIDAYGPLEPANGRMRAVMSDIFDQQLEQNLWIPPAMPYYGAARSSPPLTKALVFSSWNMVPDAIAAILSYEAERRMGVGESGRKYFEKHRLRPLQFRKDQGRLAGLRALLLIYPSPSLAQLGDPLAVFSESKSPPSADAMRAAIADRLRPAIEALGSVGRTLPDAIPTEWAGPALIDDILGMRSSSWLESPVGMRALASEDAFQEHIAELAKVVSLRNLEIKSEELSELLVDVALGSPAVCALRALKRVSPDLEWDDPRLLCAAAKVAWSFRALFNQHDSIALLRRDADDRYWHRVLTYCAEHNLQAVLDEYAHYLVDSEGLGAQPEHERAIGVGQAMATVLGIRPSQIDVDDVRVKGESLNIRKFQMRGRFAMRLADYKDEEGTVRLGSVRDAFNSPFRPFVLATTSVGQEGLDFHPYCYRVYHWNLPGNPVDLEQREGRVHRFKGHAIRLNIAEHQAGAIRGSGQAPADPWKLMFERARAEATVDSDLIPYWIYEGSVRVERRVPMLPFSREVTRLAWLKRSLTVYRLAFGQPRQDDLLEYLQKLIGAGVDTAMLDELQIRLEPMPLKQ